MKADTVTNLNVVRGFTYAEGYDETKVKLPTRGTPYSAGHDFYLPEDVVLEPGATTVVHLGITAYMQPNEVLQVHIRSSLCKQGIVITNSVGIIDADYYPNGIGLFLHNISDTVKVLQKGDRVCQGLFLEYKVAHDTPVLLDSRDGGFGSTGTN